MGTRVQLPPGCSGVTAEDGTRYTAKKGGSVVLEDRHARAIQKGVGTASQILTADFSVSIGTKKGRFCSACKRIWQAWSEICPRCGATTQPES